jgi:hypothetical protein
MIKTSIALVFALLVVFVTILAQDIPAAVGVKFLLHRLLVWAGAAHQMVAVGLVICVQRWC